MNEDLNLLYFGGNGGFFVLNCLLLSGEYECIFRNNSTIEEANNKWTINDHEKWQSRETWPDNKKTLKLKTNKRKIYFFCNPGLNPKEELNNFKNFSLLTYTDIETQWELSKYKNAFWFYEGENFENVARDNTISLIYNNIKADFWPECNTYEEFIKLPKVIFDECQEFFKSENLNLENFIEYYLDKNSRIYNNIKIYDYPSELDEIINEKILLQDTVKSKANNLYSLLNLEYNQKVSDFVDHWLSLHPPHLQTLLTGDPK